MLRRQVIAVGTKHGRAPWTMRTTWGEWTRRERDYLARLTRRRDYLKSLGSDAGDYDRAEAAALSWAIEILAGANRGDASC